MRVFNLAEELEKERKKNKELEEKRVKDNYFICGLSRENKELQEKIIIALEMCKEKQDRIDKAVEIIKKYGYEKQMEEDYLMNRVNLANYNCLLLDILKGDNK